MRQPQSPMPKAFHKLQRRFAANIRCRGCDHRRRRQRHPVGDVRGQSVEPQLPAHQRRRFDGRRSSTSQLDRQLFRKLPRRVARRATTCSKATTAAMSSLAFWATAILQSALSGTQARKLMPHSTRSSTHHSTYADNHDSMGGQASQIHSSGA